MVLTTPIQTNFTAGELGATLAGRVDLPQYFNGAKYLENAIPLASGGVTRRPPLQYKSTANFSLGYYRMIPFQSSPSASYVLVFSSQSATTVGCSVLKNGLEVHSFTLGTAIQPFDFSAGVDFAQSRDVLYIFTSADASYNVSFNSNSNKTVKITTTDDTSWTVETVDFEDGPYNTPNLDVDNTMAPSAKTGTVTMTSVGSFQFDTTGRTDIDRLISVRHKFTAGGDDPDYLKWGVARITSVTNVLQAQADVGGDYKFAQAAANRNFKLGAFSQGLKFPEKGVFHQDRLWMSRYDRLFGSVSNQFERHSPLLPGEDDVPVATDDSAIDITLADFTAERIQWLASEGLLHFATNTGRYVIRGADSYGALTPSTVSISKQSTVGASDIKPVIMNDLYYCRFDNRAIMTTRYDFNEDTYEDVNLNVLNDSILNEGVVALAKQATPFNMLWAVLGDGTFASLTVDKDNKVIAWARHSTELGEVLDVTTVIEDDNRDHVYFAIKNLSANAIHIYELDQFSYRGDLDETTEFVIDGYVTKTNATNLTGLDHLEGLTPHITQGYVNYTQTGTVNSGNFIVTSKPDSGDFEIGMPISPVIRTMGVDITTANTSQVPKVKNIDSVDVRLHRTGSLAVKRIGSNFVENVKFRTASDPVDSYPIFTGVKSVKPYDVSDQVTELEITQPEQAPMTILSLAYKVNIEP